MDILKKLLDHLRDRQSWCPYCGGEYTHREGCILEGHWFDREREE